MPEIQKLFAEHKYINILAVNAKENKDIVSEYMLKKQPLFYCRT
ncbi:MAG: hypothetical protein ACOCRZ_00270 [Halothermotrichaceae bacterium]